MRGGEEDNGASKKMLMHVASPARSWVRRKAIEVIGAVRETDVRGAGGIVVAHGCR